MSWKFGNPEIDEHHNNIIGMWKMDAASGDREDFYGSRTLSEVSGVVASAAGKDNLAADFELGDTEGLQNASEITRNITQYSISCWVWFETLPGTDQVVVWDSTASIGRTRLWVAATAADELRVGMRDTQAGAFIGASSVNTFNPTTWYHVLAVIDTVANNISAWVNNVNWINSALAMGNFHDSAAASDWQVGRAIDTGGNPYGYYDGLIDELYMWDTALDANDATALYNGGAGIYYRNRPANFFSNG